MKVIYILVILNSFAFLLNADEEAKSEELAASLKADDTNEETSATTVTDDGIVNTDDIIKDSEFIRSHDTQNTHVGSFTAYLRDPSNDEVYKSATLNIKSKNTSNKEKIVKDENKTASKSSNDKEKTKNDVINLKETSKNAEENINFKEKDKNGTEYITMKDHVKSTVGNRTLEGNDKITAEKRTPKEKDKIVEEKINSKVKNTEEHISTKEKDKIVIKKEEDKKLSTETSNKHSSETATEVETESEISKIVSTPKERSAIDDMDDLIIPYELNKFRRNYDDNDDDKTLNAETQTSHETVEPTLDGVIHNYHQNRRMFDSSPLLDSNERSESKEDLETILQTLNTPAPLKDAELPLGHFNIPSSFVQTPRPPLPYLNSFQSLRNDNKIPNPLMNTQPYQPIFHPNRRSQSLATINSPNRWENLQEMSNNPNGWSYSQEIAKNPNRLEHLQEMPNSPNRFYKSEELSSPFHLQEMSNNQNRWSQTQEFPHVIRPHIYNNRWKESQELKDSSEYKITDEADISSDSNAYPYVPPQTNQMPKPNMNPIFMKLAQASNIQQRPQLPSFLFRHPGFYRPFDPRLNIQRNFPFIPRFRRFSLENYHEMSRMLC